MKVIRSIQFTPDDLIPANPGERLIVVNSRVNSDDIAELSDEMLVIGRSFDEYHLTNIKDGAPSALNGSHGSEEFADETVFCRLLNDEGLRPATLSEVLRVTKYLGTGFKKRVAQNFARELKRPDTVVK